ncbi:MAG TPA: tRNA pseudouridine(55) synthase TruB [Anaerolineae bacterium]|nr:tRNA pseudouridine(55) synthase TruB [Anaerolineae bacterium]
MNGLLIVNKPGGMTSHDVVNVVRRLCGTRRVGHTGTLDPLATGVLVVLVGAATRLAQYIAGDDKTYRAVVRLGETTTTADAEGDLMARRPVTATCADVAAALASFRGPLMQIPPMYSAIKVEGRKLYQLARQGQEVAREPRPVTIHHLDMLDCALPDVTLVVTCSAGTYIRSLAQDLGEALWCGAHLRGLTRTAAGGFTLAQSYSLDALRALADAGRLAEALLPPQAGLEMPSISLTIEQVQAVRYGQTLPLTVSSSAARLQAHDANGRLVAILLPAGPDAWRPTLVLPE